MRDNGSAHKPLDQQTILITGASSGIGLLAARRAAARGARVVLFARSEDALEEAVAGIRESGGQALGVVGDVGNVADLEHAADEAERRFGRIDTWVNNAGVSIYGTILEVPLADHRRLFDTNYWGVVHGSMVAVQRMREHGGVIVNIGSVLSDRAVPLQGPYSASKHAVKGFTDALRMELEAADVPIAVTLIKPASIATPYPEHAASVMEKEPRLPPPVYSPSLVADAILRAAERPRRDVFVGGGGKLLSLMGQWAPRWSDRVMERTMFGLQQGAEDGERAGSLRQPTEDGQVWGEHPEPVIDRSAYSAMVRRPLRTAAGGTVLFAAAALLLSLWSRWRER